MDKLIQKWNNILTAGDFQTQDWNRKPGCCWQISNKVDKCLHLPCVCTQLCRSSLTLHCLASGEPLHIRSHFSWCEGSEEGHADQGERASSCFIWGRERESRALLTAWGLPSIPHQCSGVSWATSNAVIQFLALTLSNLTAPPVTPSADTEEEASQALLILNSFPMQAVQAVNSGRMDVPLESSQQVNA